MKTLKDYIIEANDNNSEEQDESVNHRKDIMFTIWKEPDKKVKWLKDNFDNSLFILKRISFASPIK